MRVLILHASAGAGHRRAAEAVADAFAADPGDHTVVARDILDFTPALFHQSYAKGYLGIVRRAPELWGYMYQHYDKKSLIPWRRKVRATFNKINTFSFFEFYDEFRPDVVVCTHFMPLELLSTKARSRRKVFSTPFYGIVTDFAVHSLWFLENVDCYYVATEEARRNLIRRGQSEDQIVTTGVPIDPVFAETLDRDVACRQIGISTELPVVLILSGGFGVGPTHALVEELGQSETPMQLLVVAGANEDLRLDLEQVAESCNCPVKVFGFVNNMHELISACSVAVTKTGGLTSSEILAKGKPIVVVDPIPGQEQRNCDILLEAGAAVRLYEIADASHKIGALISQPERLKLMGDAAARMGRPHSARAVVKDILSRASAD